MTDYKTKKLEEFREKFPYTKSYIGDLRFGDLEQFLLQAMTEAEENTLKDFAEFCHTKYKGCYMERGQWEYGYSSEVVFMVDEYLSSLSESSEEKKECSCACHSAYSQTDASVFEKQSCKHCQKEGGEGSTGKIYGEYGNPKTKEIWEKGKK